MARSEGKRLAYADLLRAAATFAVVILHMAGSQMSAVAANSPAWTAFNVYGGLSRWCVPVFVMLSGMFLLDPKRGLPLPRLLFHHILRIVAALFFWGTVYRLAVLAAAGGPVTPGSVWDAFYGVVLGDTHYHLWFLYMIIGLYLLTPILRAFVRGAGRGDFHWFFLVWALVCVVLPLIQHFHESATVNRWLSAMYFSTGAIRFVGFYVAGYYLKTYTLNRAAELVIYVLGVLGAAVTVGGTALLQSRGDTSLILYGYCTPNVVFMAVAVFVLFRYVLGVSEERSRRARFQRTAQISFGIYLSHDLFLMLLRRLGITTLSFLPALSVPVLAVLVFLCAWAVAWLLSKLPLIGRYLT